MLVSCRCILYCIEFLSIPRVYVRWTALVSLVPGLVKSGSSFCYRSAVVDFSRSGIDSAWLTQVRFVNTERLLKNLCGNSQRKAGVKLHILSAPRTHYRGQIKSQWYFPHWCFNSIFKTSGSRQRVPLKARVEVLKFEKQHLNGLCSGMLKRFALNLRQGLQKYIGKTRYWEHRGILYLCSFRKTSLCFFSPISNLYWK